MLIIISVIAIIAFISPPNTADTLTYHMPRVMHWQQNQSVQHYYTDISRQLYQPPFLEFNLLHLQVLSL